MNFLKDFLPVFISILFSINLSLGAVESDKKPNIIFILADDLGYGDVQCLNPKRGKIKTPQLDKLASQGMTFTDSHSGSSVCTPTRYGLLTGRYAWRTRLQNGVFDGYVSPLITADRLTLPLLLKQNGYQTACIGKWHLGFTIDGADKSGYAPNQKNPKTKWTGAPIGAVTRDGPLSRGFDTFFGFHHARMMRSVFVGDRVSEFIDPVEMLPALVKRSCDFISSQADASKPFFLYLPLGSPHDPIVPSKEWLGKSGLGIYADYVMQTDAAVGELLQALDRSGLANNTLVIFTSDNGCAAVAGIEKLASQGHFVSGDYRGSKSDIWDGGHRVPFLVRWPDKVKPGSQSKQLVCLTDFIATCAEILSVKFPDGAAEDSVSFLGSLLSKDTIVPRSAVVHHSSNGKFAIRDGNWKLVFCPGSGGWSDPTDGDATKLSLPLLQLYDLENDVGETKNLQDTHPEVVGRMKSLIQKIITDGRSTLGVNQSNDVEVKFHNN